MDDTLQLSAFQTPKVTLPFNTFPPTKSAFEMEKDVNSYYFRLLFFIYR